MKKIGVLLMGCGGVGRDLLQHILACRSLHAQQGLALRVVGVCDSKSLIAVSDVDLLVSQFSDPFLKEICRFKASSSPSAPLSDLKTFDECVAYTNAESAEKIVEIASVLGRSTGLVVVDCTASAETIGILTRVVDLGCCIVLANKKPLTVRMVGAGLPVITSLNRILASGDYVRCMIGSLSGTLGYVMSEVADGKPFSVVVKEAKSLGYTEPDPRDDLSGMDVARKALILSRLLGLLINLEDIKVQVFVENMESFHPFSVESLYPDKMGPDKMSLEDFLGSGLPLLDKDVEKELKQLLCEEMCSDMFAWSQIQDAVPSLVSFYICCRCSVGILEVPKDSALGRSKGSDNVLEIYSRCYNKLPLVIQGAGAGNDTTAAGVLADIIDLQDLFSS
ncbi:hypothetical protein Syun_017883 [Stephania yunnanensis]|uniref:Homoserine dehydrogenase n=1 Tax=Stephania yunnanensis TaxID=152371 RepID=A0AAP0P6A8_9MAGN